MPKAKIAISLDDRVLQIIDKQRGDVKRSTYINNIIHQHFSPALDSDRGGATFVTTLELRKTLKGIHDQLKALESVSYKVNDLEGLVYDLAFKKPSKVKAKTPKKHSRVKMVAQSPVPELLQLTHESGIPPEKVDAWLDEMIELHGSVRVERDLDSFNQVLELEASPMALVRELRGRGLSYNKEKDIWNRG